MGGWTSRSSQTRLPIKSKINKLLLYLKKKLYLLLLSCYSRHKVILNYGERSPFCFARSALAAEVVTGFLLSSSLLLFRAPPPGTVSVLLSSPPMHYFVEGDIGA